MTIDFEIDKKKVEAGFSLVLRDKNAGEKSLLTPKQRSMILPSQGLADLIIEEYHEKKPDQAEDAAKPRNRLYWRLALSAIDQVPHHREAIIGGISSYGQSDVVCYFAETPQALIEEEQAAWLPWIDWTREVLTIDMAPIYGIRHKPQSTETMKTWQDLISRETDFCLAALDFATRLYGSIVLAFAVRSGALDPVKALEIAHTDERFQVARFGWDSLALARYQALETEAAKIGRWFAKL